MRSAFVTSLAALAVLAFGCSSDPGAPVQHGNGTPQNPPPDDTTPGVDDTKPPPDHGTPPPPGTTITTDQTWDATTTFPQNVTIPAGKTVTIAAGATVTVPAGIAITVAGTLKSIAGATHAKLTGTGWAGLVIASGGTLAADSLDITGVKKAIWTMGGNTDATFANGIITAEQPFVMEVGSKLTINKSTVTASASPSSLAGAFVTTYMTYDKGTNEGFSFADAAGTWTTTDSTLKGNGGGDYVVVSAAKSLSISYTTISGSHCPFHFSGTGPATYTVDHISDDTNGYGWMLYGSGAGPNTISNSNFRDQLYNIEMTGTNGTVKLTNNFFGPATNPNKLQGVAQKVGVDAANPIATAKPR